MIGRDTSMFDKASGLFLTLIGGALMAGASSAYAQPLDPTSGKQIAKTIVEFKSDTVLNRISIGNGVSIALTHENILEVRVAPFAEHGNKWPVIVFGPEFFGEPINLADYSRLEVVLHHLTEGMSKVDLNIATLPDGSRNMDGEQFMVPGHTTMTARLPIKTLKNNDPSEIALVQMIFRPRETETIYHIEPIRAVYDSAIGSPAEELLGKVATAQNQINALKMNLTSKLSPAQLDAARQPIVTLGRRMETLAQDVNAARSQQFYKVLGSLSRQVDQVIGEIARLRFLGSGPLSVWEPDRYANIVRQTGPDLQDELLKHVAVRMAGNEFRDFVFMVSASQRDLSLDIALQSTGTAPLPASAVRIRQVEYLKNRHAEETGDVLLPVQGPVSVPAGQSRQFWVRFDTRTTVLSPGRYMFDLVLSDEENHLKQVFPGELEVWDFALPSYDVLPNNSYAQFSTSGFATGDGFRQAVRHMKLYGLNYIFLEPTEMPRPTGLDDQWRITGYRDEAFVYRVTGALEAWRQAPGTETLHFIFSLSGIEELGIKAEGYAFPNAQWKQVFAQWLDHLKTLITKAGLRDDQWMLVLRDESGEPELMNVEIPLAETIKSLDPSVRITCNTSTVLSDTYWTKRFFNAFDVFQPHLGRDQVLQWLRTSGKPIWVYQCQTDLTALGRNLYDYYRVYAWDMLDLGFEGTGMWTYNSHPRASWGEPSQGCLLIYKHPQLGLVHSRRYEIFREGMDDLRYVIALRRAATAHGVEAVQTAGTLIHNAVQNITTDRQDRQRCEAWRVRIAEQILSLR